MTAPTITPNANDAIQLPAMLKRIVLIGFMGAGKTTVGRLLAQSLGWEFLDLDDHLESRAQATIPDLFAIGEGHFRLLESAALANALAREQVVLALGGGTPEQLTNRLLLEQTPGTTIIYLEAPFPALFDRCMLQSFASPDHIRPVLASPEQAEVRFQLRQPFYKRLAKITLATAEMTPAEAGDALLERLAAQAK